MFNINRSFGNTLMQTIRLTTTIRPKLMVTGDHSILGTRRFAIYSLISICFAPLVTVILQFQTTHLLYS
jgi:hypothetical protein